MTFFFFIVIFRRSLVASKPPTIVLRLPRRPGPRQVEPFSFWVRKVERLTLCKEWKGEREEKQKSHPPQNNPSQIQQMSHFSTAHPHACSFEECYIIQDRNQNTSTSDVRGLPNTNILS
ncbi:hypothetical protein BO79DRAFT_66367 [Aspergillus costaricaensis CBS 115574]|uniref:Uncharacterized protein n=1 Tax=Aspergillus costaricaensis CBS 115574 TaxID=1448317 RepID=A0ACD1I102_9EURO|nr:hypothetical protein BO79DRAFT_66367 [Aspergillus costaricaensis CBS 115574]RAK83664.1 hypothetical protein BO79DRAFT_66367 [Aspergillus costaricaensis CBS 115574]